MRAMISGNDKMNGLLLLLDKISLYVHRLLLAVGGLLLIAMIVLTCANIVLRAVWLPISGTYELMGFFGAIVTAFALGHTQMMRGHISVDILVDRFPVRIRRVLHLISHVTGMMLFSLMTWQIIVLGNTLRVSGEVTESLGIIYYPFAFAVALGCAAMVLTLMTDMVRTICAGEEGGK